MDNGPRASKKRLLKGVLSVEKPQREEFPSGLEKVPHHLIDDIRTKVIEKNSLVVKAS